MVYKIGFTAQQTDSIQKAEQTASRTVAPRRSVVQVRFPSKNTTLAYYNDRFDLQPGDLVFVEGQLTGIRGRVVSVNYNFKIKLSDYKRVIGMADTHVKGQFYHAGSHFITFDRTALPAQQVITWYKAPEDEDYVSGSDAESFPLSDLSQMPVSPVIAQRGHDYYLQNRVKYLNLDDEKGYAIVEGTDAYEVEFIYRDGQISNLTCSCFCSYHCKHEVAALLQLRELLEQIENHYSTEFDQSHYFAAVDKGALFSFAIDGRKDGSFVL